MIHPSTEGGCFCSILESTWTCRRRTRLKGCLNLNKLILLNYRLSRAMHQNGSVLCLPVVVLLIEQNSMTSLGIYCSIHCWIPTVFDISSTSWARTNRSNVFRKHWRASQRAHRHPRIWPIQTGAKFKWLFILVKAYVDTGASCTWESFVRTPSNFSVVGMEDSRRRWSTKSVVLLRKSTCVPCFDRTLGWFTTGFRALVHVSQLIWISIIWNHY